MIITPTTPIGATFDTSTGEVHLCVGDLLFPISRAQLKDLKQTALRADAKLHHHLTTLDAMASTTHVHQRRASDFAPL